jgi:adenylate cyclase
MDPENLLTLLNEYLDDMTQIVLDEGGTLDKYIGDAVMAFWNAPKAYPDHADRAMRAAVTMQRHMDALNRRWGSGAGKDDLKVRIGIHTGEVVVGNLGGEGRFAYSAVGDAVNLAARLEPANKTYETLNMVSEATLAAADAAKVRVRALDYIAVKGKEEPVVVYELLELKGVGLPEEKEQALRHYEQGMAQYKRHQWAAAKAHFLAALEADPADGPSRLYAERCDAHIAHPPPPDWDFVVRRQEK